MIKRHLRAVIPESLRLLIQRHRSPFGSKSSEAIFSEIYETGFWQYSETDSRSGPGSSMESTRILRKELKRFIVQNNIQSIVDVGCGDFNWMHTLIEHAFRYDGFDLVPQLIEKNEATYGSASCRFHVLDEDTTFPKGDVVIVRDVLVHLNYEAIRTLLRRVLLSEPSFLALTHFPTIKNENVITGHWRPLNWCIAPFHFPQPDFCLREMVDGKQLAVWKVSDDVERIDSFLS